MTIPIVFRNFFQHAYIVRNTEKTIANFRDKYGVLKWQVRPIPEGAPIRAISLAYVQKVMIELIEPDPNQDSIFRDWIPESETSAKFHHLGYLIDSDTEYRKTVAQFEAAKIGVAFAGSVGDTLDFHFADTVAQLGHYCELVYLKPAGLDFFAQVPQN